MRFVMISVEDMATTGELARALGAGGLSDGEWGALSRAFERMIQTCDLLVTHAVGVAGKPSKQ